MGSLKGISTARVKRLRQVRRQLERLRIDDREMTRWIDRLQYEVEEISSARLEPGEDVALEQEPRVPSNAERVIRLADVIYRYADCGTEREPSARDQLASAHRMLKELLEVDSAIAEKTKMVYEMLLAEAKVSTRLTGTVRGGDPWPKSPAPRRIRPGWQARQDGPVLVSLSWRALSQTRQGLPYRIPREGMTGQGRLLTGTERI